MRARLQNAYASLGSLAKHRVVRQIVLRNVGSTELDASPCHFEATRAQQSRCLRQRAKGGNANGSAEGITGGFKIHPNKT